MTDVVDRSFEQNLGVYRAVPSRLHEIRPKFRRYLACNLRADLQDASPYLRAIQDPFGALTGETVEGRQVRRAVQLRVREFATAEHLDLTVRGDAVGGVVGDDATDPGNA
ncbi:MAG: hypothetical protein KF906_08675 [Actinobacteria bacterium]|nr:hypothetical protein [Actinomycetota bacterium]